MKENMSVIAASIAAQNRIFFTVGCGWAMRVSRVDGLLCFALLWLDPCEVSILESEPQHFKLVLLATAVVVGDLAAGVLLLGKIVVVVAVVVAVPIVLRPAFKLPFCTKKTIMIH